MFTERVEPPCENQGEPERSAPNASHGNNVSFTMSVHANIHNTMELTSDFPMTFICFYSIVDLSELIFDGLKGDTWPMTSATKL